MVGVIGLLYYVLMKESFPSNNVKSPEAQAQQQEREYKKRYEALPAARPRMFQHDAEKGESHESPFVFPPIEISVTPDDIED